MVSSSSFVNDQPNLRRPSLKQTSNWSPVLSSFASVTFTNPDSFKAEETFCKDRIPDILPGKVRAGFITFIFLHNVLRASLRAYLASPLVHTRAMFHLASALLPVPLISRCCVGGRQEKRPQKWQHRKMSQDASLYRGNF